jgi:hypothetical protein
MQIELMPYERRAIEAIEKAPGLDRELVVGFARSLSSLADMFERAIKGNGELRAGHVVTVGLINHTHHLLAGGVQTLRDGNGPVWSACVRGLIETFGACVLISERPGTAPNYLKPIKPGKLRAAAERAKPGLLKDIHRLDQVVHPASGAIYAGFKTIGAGAKSVHVRFGLNPPDRSEGTEGVIVLANLAALLVEKLEDLLSRPEVLSAGKAIMVRTANP